MLYEPKPWDIGVYMIERSKPSNLSQSTRAWSGLPAWSEASPRLIQ